MTVTAFATSPITIIPLSLIHDDGTDLAEMEATDVTLFGQTFEQVDVGPLPGTGGTYLRITAPDLVAAVAGARKLLDEIESVVLDARQDAAEAERHVCPFCRTLIEADEDTCGAASCRRELGREIAVEAWT